MDGIRVEWRRVSTSLPRDEGFLVGRDLIRSLVSAVTGEPAGDVIVSATCPDCGGPHGRPIVNGGVHVSLSRCTGFIVAAASAVGPIGVDVEPHHGDPGRVEAIAALTGERSLRHWTRIEAVLKADGRGLRVDPSLVLVDGTEARVPDRPTRYRLSEPPVHPSLIVTTAQAILH